MTVPAAGKEAADIFALYSRAVPDSLATLTQEDPLIRMSAAPFTGIEAMMDPIAETIAGIYQTGRTTGDSGSSHRIFPFAISAEEGAFLLSVIAGDPKVSKTLEVGCAYGLSSLHICAGIRGRSGASHTIIDPFQTLQWDGAGIKNLRSCGVDFFHLIEEKSEFALPKLLEKREGQFDFIFIDGYHAFDHVLLDCFYANRLLKVGGYLVFDDLGWLSVSGAVSFLLKYPCYAVHGSVKKTPKTFWEAAALRFLMPLARCANAAGLFPSRSYRNTFYEMIALKKITEDKRSGSWHEDPF